MVKRVVEAGQLALILIQYTTMCVYCFLCTFPAQKSPGCYYINDPKDYTIRLCSSCHAFFAVMERPSVLSLLFYAIVFAITASDSVSGQVRKLHVLLMTSSSQRFNSSGAETAVRQAQGRVNTETTILPGYELHVASVRDTKVKF